MSDVSAASTARRRPWLAGILSLLMPGLGQLYDRQVGWALALLAITFAMAPVQFLIVQLPPSAGIIAYVGVLVVGFGARLVAIVQAVIAAHRIGVVQPAWYNRWYVYVGLSVAAVAWNNSLAMLPISTRASYSIPSNSMAPTLLVGDYLEARTLAFHDRMPIRGEIAVFRTPAEPDVDFIHRIIGLPGDRIQLREGRLYLNAALVERVPLSETEAAPLVRKTGNVRLFRETLPGGVSYLIAEVSDSEAFDNTPEFVVPEDHVFVLGDNRDRSNDSRADRGFISIEGLRDMPLFIYWSADASRIGKVLE